MSEQKTMSNLESVYGLSGKNALVTGGGTGIGLAIAGCLLQTSRRMSVGPVLFTLPPAAGYVTGQVLLVDGDGASGF